MRKYILILFGGVLMSSCFSGAIVSQVPSKKPRNVILLIGDGMGITQITAGLIKNGRKLNLERCTAVGLSKTFAYGKDLITDSAAGATALACGVKTFNGACGVDHNSKPVPTLLEIAEKQGRQTGMVVTSSITHATPASFVAHVPDRAKMKEIASYFVKSGIDCFIGGGKSHFESRPDKRNITAELIAQGYKMYNHVENELDKFIPNPEEQWGFFTAESEPLPYSQGRDYLPNASVLACKYLQERAKINSNSGFFLMIEGSQIDWGGHANQSDYLVSEMIDFDNTIGKVLDFAKADGNTLVIITADHECGGYSVVKGTTDTEIVGKFATDYHTPDMVPVFAYGPGAELFSGIYENTAIFDKILRMFTIHTPK